MALAKAKKIERVGITAHAVPVKIAAAAACFQGGLAILAGGYARPARLGQGADNAAKAVDAATYRAVGVFTESVTGGVANGDVSSEVLTGAFKFKNSAAGDLITEADIGRACYVIDDETVAKTNPNAVRCVAGAVIGVDADGGVLVDVSPTITACL